MTGEHPANFDDLTGQTFGSWTVEKFAFSKNWRAFWKCRCQCGREKIMRGDRLRSLSKPYCQKCKPRQSVMVIDALQEAIAARVRLREDGLFANTFIVDGNIVYGYTSNKSCFLFNRCDLPIAINHTWLRKKLRGGWYVATNYQGKEAYFHTVILGNFNGEKHIDHINRDKLDNRRENLRFCVLQENAFNKGIGANNTKGFKGLSRHKSGRWNAYISFCQRQIYLGTYDFKERGAAAYDYAAGILFDVFACKNREFFPDVPMATERQKRYIVDMCLKRLTGWEWKKNPEILREAMIRLQDEKQRLCGQAA